MFVCGLNVCTGIGECYEAFSHIFGPILSALHAHQQLPLTIPAANSTSPSPSPLACLPARLTKQDKIRGMSVYGHHVSIDISNTFISPTCTRCKSICHHHHIDIPTSNDTHRRSKHPPTSADLFTAADMKTMRTLLGMQEANTYYLVMYMHLLLYSNIVHIMTLPYTTPLPTEPTHLNIIILNHL